jgi:hypothetical protein
MLKTTEPLPLPLAPDVIVIHVALLAAVQAQPVPAVTATVRDPPPLPMETLVGLTEYVHT